MAAYLCAAMVLKKYRAMHNYNKVEKEIIDLLRDQDVRDIKLLGNTIQKAFPVQRTMSFARCARPSTSLRNYIWLPPIVMRQTRNGTCSCLMNFVRLCQATVLS